MTLKEMKNAYRTDKARASEERTKLENMRTAFSAQGEKVSRLELSSSNLKQRIVDLLMEMEGLEL